MPLRPWRGSPERYAAPIPISAGASVRSNAASSAILALRLGVSATRRDVATTSANSVIRPFYGSSRSGARPATRSAPSSGCERRYVDRHAHRVIAGVVGVQVVPRQLGELAVGQELLAHVARIRVQRGRVKVFHAVEQPGRTNEVVKDLPAGVVPRPVVAPVDAADTERGGHCAGEDFDTARVQAADNILIAGDDRVGRVAGSEVVDTLEPDHMGQS